MPIIPDVTNIRRNIPQPSTRIVRVDTRGAGMGLDMLGQGIADLGKIGERKSQLEASKAETEFLIKKMEHDTNAKHDEDFRTLPDRYTATLKEELGTIAGNISDSRRREEFLNRGKVLIAQGQMKVADIAWGKEVDYERGSLNEILTSLRNNTLKSDTDIVEAGESAMRLIEASADTGYISEQEKSKMIADFRNDIAVGKLEMMEPEKQVEALKQKWSENLPPDVHAKLSRQAKKATIAGKAQSLVDDYMGAELDRDEANDKISKIKDTTLRDETKRRFDYDFGKQKEAKIERQSELFNKYYLKVREGTMSVDKIPDPDLEAMSPAQQNSLFSAMNNSVKSPRKYSDRAVVDDLNILYQTKQFGKLRKYFEDNANSLNETDYKSWSQVSVKGVVPIEVKSLFTAQQLMNAKLTKAGVTSDTDKETLKTSLNEWYQDYQETNNRIPTDKERDEQIDRMLLEFDTSWAWGGGKRVFQMDEGDRDYVLNDVKEENPELFNDVTNYFTKNKLNPSFEQFMEAFQKLKDMRDAAK